MTFTIIDVSNIYLARQYDLISHEAFLKLHAKLNKTEETDAMVVRIDRIDRTDGACRADDDTPGAEVKEHLDADR